MLMHQISRLLGWTIVLAFVAVVAGMIWVLTQDTFTGQGCETMEFCRAISDYLPNWIVDPTF